MELIFCIISLFIEGLKFILDVICELIVKKFKGVVGLNIGMSFVLVIGYLVMLVVLLLLIFVIILLVVVFLGNEFLLLVLLVGMFYVFLLILFIIKGNVVKIFIIGFVVLVIGLYFVIDLVFYFIKVVYDVYVKI